ncbi:MAG: hypothetical protein DRP87_12145 [Spirochaetes bacterium]|nr:MAG: hypothetical protein DRP87_12145 [Spirochaetota bacterium]
MMTLRLAFRNLLRQKRRTIFTGLSMLVGFVMGCFFIGWADGAYNHIIDSFTRQRLGHIQIHKQGYLGKPSLYKTIDNPERVGKILDTVGHIDSWAPRLFSAGLVSAGEKSAGVQVIGIDTEREERTTNISNKIVEGNYFDNRIRGVILGKDLARNLHAGVRDSVVILSQAADGSIANARYPVTGLIDTGDPGLNRSAFYLPLEYAQELFVLEGKVHEIAVNAANLNYIEKVAKELKSRLSGTGLHVADWKEFAHEFYVAMSADKGGMYVMLVIVVIIVAITVLNTILMSVLERQKEYGVLKAIGTRPGSLVRMVLIETALLAGACILLGSVIGYFMNLYFAEYGLKLANPIEWGGVQIKYMKGEVNFKSFYLPTITVLVTALLVCFFPALRAARTEPAKTMRTF